MKDRQANSVKPRLWVVSEVYYPEETSTGYYLTAIGEGLVDRFDVKVLCGQPNYSKRGMRAPKHELHLGTEIFRATGTRLNKNIIPFRLMNMLTLGVSVFVKALHRFRRGDSVLVVTTPPTMPFIVAIASLLRGAGYVLLIHDSYPETLVAVKKIRRNAFAARTIDYFNRWLFKHARKIIVVGRDMAELICKKASGLDIPVAVIPNWAEIDNVVPSPREDNALIRDLGIGERLVILHAGNIGHPTDIETIAACFDLLNSDGRFQFVFLGSGVKRRLLEMVVQEKRFDGLTLLESRPRSEQAEFLNACDVGMISLVDGMFGVAMPSKTYNLMAAGKPLLALADPNSELARVIDEEGIGWHIRPGDPQELKNVLENIFENRSALHEMGRRARSAAVEKYSLNIAIERYAAELE
jgi:glycosyltransferase involved in cell wall biosynthesis